MGVIKTAERRVLAAVAQVLRLEQPIAPPSGTLQRLALWLLLLVVLLGLLHWLPGLPGLLFSAIGALATAALVIVGLLLGWRYIADHFLWKVRNRLIVSYLLLGLSPLILFGTLAAAASYVFLGQFATVAASSEIERAVAQIANQNAEYARILSRAELSPSTILPMRNAQFMAPRAEVSVFRNGTFMRMQTVGDRQAGKPPSAVLQSVNSPKWAPQHWHGVILNGDQLSLCAIDTEINDGVATTVVSTAPLTTAELDTFATGLGRITVLPDVKEENAKEGEIHRFDSSVGDFARAHDRREHPLVGGTLPSGINPFDIPVSFFAPMASTDWGTGKVHQSYLDVTSRPTLLYHLLFSTSLRIATIVRDSLIGIGILFILLELLACIMALRLNTTITESVSHLYDGTLAVDAGRLQHRIPVHRSDQLSELSRSFNTMTSSLERLLEEQREKERLQGELEIAQEVQANLFPRSRADLPSLEVYGICQPARTVSGDYYDFLVAGRNELSIALGDISGKGISAALLMASLHSAVRAYRFAGADWETLHAVEHPDAVPQPLSVTLASPGQVLGLLNRHLYRSTQPEKYATLFLAFYDGDTGTLTYSNGGQLPPLLLRTSGEITRLDCGGTVVGLMDHMRYEQGIETMQTGDVLVAYSDGVTEPENDFGDFGEERLVSIVNRHRNEPLEAISAEVLRALRDWIGDAEQPDDITLVLARQR